MVGLLEVLDDVGEARAIDKKELVLAFERRQAHARRQPIGDAPAQRRVLHAAVSRLGEQPLAHAMQQVVGRGSHRDVARAAVVGAALVAKDDLVHDPRVAIDNGTAAVGIVEGVATRGVPVGGRAPKMGVGKAGEGHGLVPSHQALIQGRAGRPCGPGRPPVRGVDRERHQDTAGLARDDSRVHAIPCHGVPVQSVVPHRDVRGRRRGIQAVSEPHGDHAICVLRPGGNPDGLAQARQHRRMGDGVNGGADVGDASGIGLAWGSQVARHDQRGGVVGMIAAKAEQEFRPASHPARPGPKGDIVVRREGCRETDSDRIGPGVQASLSEHAQAQEAVASSGGLDLGPGMVAGHQPSRRARLKPRIGHDVGARGPDNLDVVHEALAIVEEPDVEAVHGAVAVVHAPLPFHQRPGSLLRFVRVRPVRREFGVGVGILEFQAGAAAVRPLAPRTAIRVTDLTHGDVDDVRRDDALAVGGLDVIGLGEPDDVATVSQGSLITPEHPCSWDVGMVGPQLAWILGKNEELARPQPCTGREIERNPAAHPPARQVHRACAAMGEFHELVGAAPGRVIEDLVDHHVFQSSRRIRGAGRGLRQPTPYVGSIRASSKGDAIFLGAKPKNVEDAPAVRRQQIDRLAGRREPESQGHLIPCHLGSTAQHRPGGNAKSMELDVVRQDAAGQVHRHGGAVVNLDKVGLGKVRMGEDLVQDDRVQGRGFHRFWPSRRAAADAARDPSHGVLLSAAWRCQHQGMPRAVRSHGPRCKRRVLNLELHGADRVTQAQGVARVVQRPGPGPQHRCKPRALSQGPRLRRHHHPSARLQE